MANTVSVLSYANTFGDWVVATNRLTSEVNDIGFNNYIKPRGTLYLNEPTLGLQVANNAIVQGQLQITGIGSSAYIQNNLEVNSGQVYFSNTILGLTNAGQSIFGGRINANGPTTGLAVANNTTIGGYLRVSSNAAIVGPAVLSNTLSVLRATTLSNTLSVTNATTLNSTLAVAENSTFGNNITVTSKTSTYDLFAETLANTGTLRVRTNGSFGGSVGVVGTIYADRLQANTSVTTTFLNVVDIALTDILQANTSIDTKTLFVQGNTYTNVIQSNNSLALESTTTNLYATATILGDTIRANTSLSTETFLASSSGTVNSLQSNTSVNTSTLTAASTIIGREIRSNNGISAISASISGLATSNTFIANTSITTPIISVNNLVNANGAVGWFGTLNTLGRLSVGGDFIINGNTVYNSPNFTLSAQNPNQISTINAYRTPGANATIRWNEINTYWDIKDVETSQFYRVITEQQLTNSVTTVSSILGATATAANTLNNSITTLNNYLVANVTLLQNQITANTASLQGQITSNVVSLQAQITSNAAISGSGISASFARANSSAQSFTGTTGSASPTNPAGVITFTGPNGITITGSGSTLSVNTSQDLRSTGSPTFNALTLTNALPIASGGTGASDKNSALFNLVPTTTGVPAGYVLATGGAGGSSFYWAAGGSGGGSGAIPGTTIASSRVTATGSGSTLAYNTPVYVPGAAQLRTYINGVRQFASEYTETSGNTAGVGIVTFSTAPQLNDNIVFEVDGYIINPYYANNISFTANPTIGSTANTIQLAIDGLTSLAAPKVSPTFTGVASAVTPAVGTNTTQIATTKFVNDSLNAGTGTTYTHSISGNATTTSQTNFSNLTIGGSQVVSAANYNTYAPTLTGGGASGSWNISAAQLGGLVLQSAGAVPGGNQVLRSDVSGYTYHQYINSASPNSENPTISQIIVTNGSDNFYRKSSIAAFTSAVQTNASGSWNITATAATNATNGRYVYNNGAYSGSGYVEPSDLGVRYAASSGTCTTAARATRANGNLYIDDNYGLGVVGVYSASRYQGVYSMGSSWALAADGTATGNLYGLSWSHPNAGGAAGNMDSHGLLCLINGGYASSMSNSIKAAGNITAYSDERLKTNWRSLSDDFISKLAKVKCGIYDRLDRDLGTQVGVSAQSLQEILPEAIETANDEMKTLSVHYGNAALASAVELAKEVVLLKEMMKELKAEIEVLKGNSK